MELKKTLSMPKILILLFFVATTSFGADSQRHIQFSDDPKAITGERTGYIMSNHFRRPAGVSCDEFELMLEQELQKDWDDYPMSFGIVSDVCEEHSTHLLVEMSVSENSATESASMKKYLEIHKDRLVFGSRLYFTKEVGYAFPVRMGLMTRIPGCSGCVRAAEEATSWILSDSWDGHKTVTQAGIDAVGSNDLGIFLGFVESTYGPAKKLSFDQSLKEAERIEFTVFPLILLEDGKTFEWPFGAGAMKDCGGAGQCFNRGM